MFEFSLSELTVVMVVALIVIGPERLPKVARTLGHLYGRARRYVNGVKADISRDLAIEEFRQLQQKVQAEAAALEASARQTGQQIDQQVGQLNRSVASAVSQPLPPDSAAVAAAPGIAAPAAVVASATETATPAGGNAAPNPPAAESR